MTLTGASQQPQTRVLAMWTPSGAHASGLGSTKPYFSPRGFSNWAIPTPLHCASITWSLATTRLECGALTQGFIVIPLPLQAAEFGALGPLMHCMRSVCPAPRWTSLILVKDTNIFSWPRPRVCIWKFSLKTGRHSQTPSVRVVLVQLFFGPSGGDSGPGDSHVRSSVHGNNAWFVTGPAL
jgi:hypothetical protein